MGGGGAGTNSQPMFGGKGGSSNSVPEVGGKGGPGGEGKGGYQTASQTEMKNSWF